MCNKRAILSHALKPSGGVCSPPSKQQQHPHGAIYFPLSGSMSLIVKQQMSPPSLSVPRVVEQQPCCRCWQMSRSHEYSTHHQTRRLPCAFDLYFKRKFCLCPCQRLFVTHCTFAVATCLFEGWIMARWSWQQHARHLPPLGLCCTHSIEWHFDKCITCRETGFYYTQYADLWKETIKINGWHFSFRWMPENGTNTNTEGVRICAQLSCWVKTDAQAGAMLLRYSMYRTSKYRYANGKNKHNWINM